jgi:hypothetical protein
MFPLELEQHAFRARNGEYGWTRAQIPLVAQILCRHGLAILGGELWWVRDGVEDWVGVIPQRRGDPAVYSWETEREPVEPWQEFVERGVADTLSAADRWPGPDDLPSDLGGRILYNLCWVSESEHADLCGGRSNGG